jgi:[protein-PII] uridylyltransferase
MKMHELGLLSQYIPEFSQVEGKVHYDLYHVHPVDIHSILAVEELAKLKKGYYEKDYPLLTSLIREVNPPEILFLATFLHDIGKGMEGNHSLAGAEIGMRIGKRMGLSAQETEWIGDLIRHHLLMVEIAFRRDLHDEQVILRFANKIKTLHQLKMLYLLTFADIKAVGPEAWTSWKHALLMELFLKTSHFFERDAATVPFANRGEVVGKLREVLSPEIFSKYVEHLPDRYLSCYTLEEITHHLQLARSVEQDVLLAEWRVEREVQARVTICTKDRYGLFSKITGSMFLNHLNILESQIHTWENGIALDTFWVQDVTKEIERRLERFKQDLKDILTGQISLRDLLSKAKESNGIKQKVIPRVPGEVKINNHDSGFYTIVEVSGEDRLGILYELTQALTDHGCDIHFARVSTLGNRIVDVFYIQDEFGEKFQNKYQTDQLRKTVQNVLTPYNSPS